MCTIDTKIFYNKDVLVSMRLSHWGTVEISMSRCAFLAGCPRWFMQRTFYLSSQSWGHHGGIGNSKSVDKWNFGLRCKSITCRRPRDGGMARQFRCYFCHVFQDRWLHFQPSNISYALLHAHFVWELLSISDRTLEGTVGVKSIFASFQTNLRR